MNGAQKPRFVARFIYENEDSSPRGCVERMEPGFDGKKKDFWPRLALSFGGFAAKVGLNGTRLPLYHLPEVLDACAKGLPIIMTEGEGKCDVLREELHQHGYDAAVTTIAFGSNNSLPDEYAVQLRGSPRIYVFADSDAPGRKCANERAAVIKRCVPEAEVRAVDLFPDDDGKDKRDVADWFEDGRDVGELLEVANAATPLSIEMKASTNGKVTATNGSTHPSQGERSSTDHDAAGGAFKARWVLESAADIAAGGIDPVEFDIAMLLTKDDGPALLFGPPGSWKSFLAMHVCRCVATGESVLGKFAVRRRSRSIFINFDAGRQTTRRRIALVAPGITNLFVTSPDGYDAAALREVFEHNEDGFIVLDCFSDMYSSNRGEDQAETMRRFLRELRTLYQKHRCNGLVIDHPRRAREGETVGDYYGSVQKEATMRTMWVATQLHSDDPAIGKLKVTCKKMSEAERFPAFVAKITFGNHIDFAYDGRVDDVSGATVDVMPDTTLLEQLLRGVAGGMTRAALMTRLDWGKNRVLEAARDSKGCHSHRQRTKPPVRVDIRNEPPRIVTRP